MRMKSKKKIWWSLPATKYRYLAGILAVAILSLVWESHAVETKKENTPPSAVQQMKEAILKKNIFSPARFVRPTLITESTEIPPGPSVDTGPKELEKPFVVVGITYLPEERWAYLSFIKEQGLRRKVVSGDVIETITVKEIMPTYLVCDYAGKEVRITQGESSSDAYRRVKGILGGEYSLIGTTDTAAQILIKGETRPRWFYVGNMLGNAQVVEIQPGRVILIDQYGEKKTLE